MLDPRSELAFCVRIGEPGGQTRPAAGQAAEMDEVEAVAIPERTKIGVDS